MPLPEMLLHRAERICFALVPGNRTGDPVNVSQATLASGTSRLALESDTRRARRNAISGSAIGYATDGFDLLILGFMLRPISADLGLDAAAGARSLVTATLFGAVVGGFVFGWLSDRLGRVRVLAWTIVLFAVFTGLCALCAGLLGPAGLPHHRRPRPRRRIRHRHGAGGRSLSGVASARGVSSYVGARLAGRRADGCARHAAAAAVIGWRGMFLLGILPGVVAYFIRRTLQSPRCSSRARRQAQPAIRRSGCW